MRRLGGVCGMLMIVTLAGCSEPPRDLGDPQELAAMLQAFPVFDPSGSLNVAEASEGAFLLASMPACAEAPMDPCPPPAEAVAPLGVNASRFRVQWTVTGDGIDGPVATGPGGQVTFPLAHATTYHGQAVVVDVLSNETVFTRMGEAMAVWHFTGDVEAPPGPAARVTVSELPATLDAQTLHATVAATPQMGPEADAQVFVVFPDGTEETIASGAEVRLGPPGTYLLQWQAVLPVQTPHTLHVDATFFVEGGGGHDMMMHDGAMER